MSWKATVVGAPQQIVKDNHPQLIVTVQLDNENGIKINTNFTLGPGETRENLKSKIQQVVGSLDSAEMTKNDLASHPHIDISHRTSNINRGGVI